MSVEVLHDFKVLELENTFIVELKFNNISKNNPKYKYQWIMISEDTRFSLEFLFMDKDLRILKCGCVKYIIDIETKKLYIDHDSSYKLKGKYNLERVK